MKVMCRVLLVLSLVTLLPGCALFASQAAPADLRATVASQATAISVAADKLRAGQFTTEQILVLLENDAQAWASLDDYYNGGGE